MKDYKERKNFTTKTEFIMEKAISKSYTLDCSSKFPSTFTRSYA